MRFWQGMKYCAKGSPVRSREVYRQARFTRFSCFVVPLFNNRNLIVGAEPIFTHQVFLFRRRARLSLEGGIRAPL